jgi:hypothetical protein
MAPFRALVDKNEVEDLKRKVARNEDYGGVGGGCWMRMSGGCVVVGCTGSRRIWKMIVYLLFPQRSSSSIGCQPLPLPDRVTVCSVRDQQPITMDSLSPSPYYSLSSAADVHAGVAKTTRIDGQEGGSRGGA